MDILENYIALSQIFDILLPISFNMHCLIKKILITNPYDSINFQKCINLSLKLKKKNKIFVHNLMKIKI